MLAFIRTFLKIGGHLRSKWMRKSAGLPNNPLGLTGRPLSFQPPSPSHGMLSILTITSVLSLAFSLFCFGYDLSIISPRMSWYFFKELSLIFNMRFSRYVWHQAFHAVFLLCHTWYRMEMERFELLTPCLQGRCSPNWATPPRMRVFPQSYEAIPNLFICFFCVSTA